MAEDRIAPTRANHGRCGHAMRRFLLATMALPLCIVGAFVHPPASSIHKRLPTFALKMSSETTTSVSSSSAAAAAGAAATTTTPAPPGVPNFNGVDVAKTGGQGVSTASEQAVAQNLSLGAPRGRPKGGHFLTKGGIQVTANVEALEFSQDGTQAKSSEAVIERLVQQLDSHKGVLLTSSYEFPGRYARWSLGFVDPPLEVSGKADKCTIRALNSRGRVLLPAIEKAMQELKQQEILSDVAVYEDATSGDGTAPSMAKIDVTVVPPPEVGTFSEEERSRQVGTLYWLQPW